jgi:hypothetical protein
MPEVLLEAQSPARFADAFMRVHVGQMCGVDYIDAVTDEWLGVEFYEADDEVTGNIQQDRKVFEERTGHEVAHVTIDREEARVRAQQARRWSEEEVTEARELL